MRDIDYFTESKMDEGSALDFYTNLPNERLKNIFKEAMSEMFGWNDVTLRLQQYRHKFDYGGVKTIEFQYDISAHYNWVPVIGTAFWLAKTQVFSSTLIHIYFDSSTGEMLSKSDAESRREKNKSSENHFEAGEKFESDEKYQQAFEEYNKAYQECSREYKNENKFLQHRDRAKDETDSDALTKEGERELLLGDLTSALSNFQAAADKTNIRKQSILNKIALEKNKAAETHFERGKILENQGDFEEASKEYKNAFQICSTNYKRKKVFDDHYNMMRNEIHAAAIQDEAEEALACNNLTLALEKFQSAHDMTVKNKRLFRKKIEFVRNEIAAAALKDEGKALFAEGKYTKALEKYESAWNKSNCSSMKSICASLIEEAEDELSAIDEFRRGNDAFEAGDYTKAKQHFIHAQSGTKSKKTKEASKEMLDLANTERDALKIHQKAQVAFKDNEFGKAITLLKSAISKSKHKLNQQKLQAKLDFVRNELEVKEIVVKAVHLFDQQKYEEAAEMYQKACEKANQEDRRENLTILEKQCKNEAKAQKLAKEGDELYKQSKLLQALENYQNAREISSVETEKVKYATLITKVQNELNQDLTKDANNLLDQLTEETNVVIEKVYQLMSALKECHAINETTSLIENLRKYFNDFTNQLESIHTKVVDDGQRNVKDEVPKEELLELIELRIENGSLNNLEKAGQSILKLLKKESDKVFVELNFLFTGLEKVGTRNQVSEIKQRLREHSQKFIEQINSMQVLASNNQPDLTSHYEKRSQNIQRDEQQKPVRVINYQNN